MPSSRSRDPRFTHFFDPDAGRTLYDVLHVAPNADAATIKQAYRDLVKVMHPDRNGGDGAHLFAEIQFAYEILGDPSERGDYDRSRPATVTSGSAAGPSGRPDPQRPSSSAGPANHSDLFAAAARVGDARARMTGGFGPSGRLPMAGDVWFGDSYLYRADGNWDNIPDRTRFEAFATMRSAEHLSARRNKLQAAGNRRFMSSTKRAVRQAQLRHVELRATETWAQIDETLPEGFAAAAPPWVSSYRGVRTSAPTRRPADTVAPRMFLRPRWAELLAGPAHVWKPRRARLTLALAWAVLAFVLSLAGGNGLGEAVRGAAQAAAVGAVTWPLIAALGWSWDRCRPLIGTGIIAFVPWLTFGMPAGVDPNVALAATVGVAFVSAQTLARTQRSRATYPGQRTFIGEVAAFIRSLTAGSRHAAKSSLAAVIRSLASCVAGFRSLFDRQVR